MPKKDLQDSVVEKCKELAHSLKVVREDIRKITNYERTLTESILDYCELYGIKNNEIKSFDIKEIFQKKSIPLKEILKIFPNDDVKTVIENIVAKVDIDLDQTELNLRYSGEFQDVIINKIIKQLRNTINKKVKKVDLKWNI